MGIEALNSRQLAAYFDHSLLQPYNVMSDYERHVEECIRYGFYSAAINSHIVLYYAGRLKDSGVLVGAAIGFPFGQACVKGKLEEAKAAIEDGADELDYVLNISRLLDGNRAYIRDEMSRLVDLGHGKGVVVKVILENCYLGEAHKLMACELAVETGIDYLKTSTGFGPGGATPEDVSLMRKAVGDKVKIKAAGAMRDLSGVAAMIDLGVDRIGSAFGVSIMEEFAAKKENGGPVLRRQ